MQGCHNHSEPFFAYIATNAPHGPLWVPDEYRQPYLNGIRRDEASFFGMIANIDENMAQLERFLLDNGIRDNTILIFMTDNGTATGQDIYNAGMRGKKTSLYEGGHRVPCFIRWPQAGLDGGQDVGGVTRGVDILPTLIDLCDLQVPDGWTCDGLSLASHLRRPDQSVAARISIVQYGHANEDVEFGFTGREQAAVMWRQWRLVQGRELYNVQDDPGQQRDVAAANPELVKRMRDDYAAWWDGVRRYPHELPAPDDRRRCREPGPPVQLRLGLGLRRQPARHARLRHGQRRLARQCRAPRSLQLYPAPLAAGVRPGHLRPGARYAGRGRQLACGQGPAGCLSLAAGRPQ